MATRVVIALLLVILALITIVAAEASAQSPDYVILGKRSTGWGTIWGATRASSSPKGLIGLPFGFTYNAMTEGPGDDSVYVLGSQQTSSLNRVTLFRASTQKVTTLGVYPMSGSPCDMAMDDAGDLRFILHSNNPTTLTRVYSVRPGGPAPSLVASFPPTFRYRPNAFAEDPLTGDWLATSPLWWIHRITRTGSVVTSIAKSPYYMWHPDGGLTFDPDRDEFVIANDIYLASFDRTFKFSGWKVQGTYLLDDVHFDAISRTYLTCGTAVVSGGAQYSQYTRTDRQGVVYAQGRASWDHEFVRIRSICGRRFTPLSAPVRGATYRIWYRVHDQPGLHYRAALAFSHFPGIKTTIGNIPLNADGLFHLSIARAPLFGDLAGRLGFNGGATIELKIPQAKDLQGLRLHLAAVTMDATGFRSVSGPLSFTIR